MTGHMVLAERCTADQARAEQSGLLDNGQATWPFVHVEDAAPATAAADDAPSGVYVVADSDPSIVSSWLPAFARKVISQTERGPALG